jgi:hypothetical protein
MADLALVNVISKRGIVPLDLDDRDASIAARHRQAALRYRDEGDASGLEAFDGVVVGEGDGEVELESDPEQIEFLAAQGQLDFEDFYEDG